MYVYLLYFYLGISVHGETPPGLKERRMIRLPWVEGLPLVYAFKTLVVHFTDRNPVF